LEVLSYLSILLLAVLGTPIFVVMSLFALSAFHFADVPGSAMVVEIYRLANAPTLLTIPLFTFAGYLMAESKSPQRLLNLANACLGKFPGGIAIVSLVVCAFFTAFTGASGVTIIALGGLLYPILRKEGYTEKFSLGLITTSGSLGLLFPPSLPIILYGIVAKVDIDKLFKAGLLPGLLLIAVLSVWSMVQKKEKYDPSTDNIKTDFVDTPKLPFKQAIWQARYEIPLPFMILGGIYGGIVTATEASALTAVYVFMIECVFIKDVSITKDIPNIIKESMTLVGAILLILCCALGLTNYLVDEEIPMRILDMMKQHIHSKYMFLFFLNIFLLIVGSLMDIFSAIIVVVPIILPLAAEFGVDPIHLAVIFLTNLEIGYITPPVGINLFISSFRFNKPVLELYKASLPYLALLIFALLIITYVPALTLFWFD
jgi:C4-dicarboxylate transporter DctM subunit